MKEYELDKKLEEWSKRKYSLYCSQWAQWRDKDTPDGRKYGDWFIPEDFCFEVKQLSEFVKDIMEYFGLGYYNGKLCTKDQVEKIAKTIKENTVAVKERK